ncbi:ABC-type multidrug transport system ATPase subunit [Cryobacterium sp. MP_M3]|uniref:ABC transporter ATP-binding protein n=1 Tax=unclassified Cryobacterium TaxID=2649013 RepID=UPI0018CAB781|nr:MULTISPECIES: ABC transporter ATP-binding protein [unclassified Cryobacterium]MBG6058387.1 ABC-type multidrug transport system ATPase subunit [Cryobacterium sp. MP_M3]
MRRPDGGTLRVAGVDPTRAGRRLSALIGVQLQASALPDSFRVGEAMRFFCAYHGIAPRLDLLDRVGLGDRSGAQHHELSGGQQRRLALALAVAHDPAALILDEPTSGLDVASRTMLHELIRELQAAGTTVLLATHDMAEASELATRVAILLRGAIAATGTPLEPPRPAEVTPGSRFAPSTTPSAGPEPSSPPSAARPGAATTPCTSARMSGRPCPR